VLTVLCCSCPQSLPTGQTSPLLAGSLSTASAAVYCSIFHLPAAFSPAGRSFLTTNPHETHFSPQKKYICNNSYVFFPISSPFPHFSLQNEQIFNCNCTKDFDSASSKVSLVKGPTPINSAFSTLSISSPIHTSSSNSLPSSKCTRSGYTYQRWCQYPPK
jgi:hypothetical protein